MQLLEVVAEKFDAVISTFTHLDKEFSHMNQITKSLKFLENMEGVVMRNGIGLQAKHSWATLHSLLHSERISYRQNGYIWLGDLLIAQINGERDGNIWSSITYFLQKIAQAGTQDSSNTSDVPLPILLMCGLLKSKYCYIRWGFLFVLERLLMRCKFLLDEHEMQQTSNRDLGHGKKDWHLEKANAIIDIMSGALSLVFQINETDRINILKVIVSELNVFFIICSCHNIKCPSLCNPHYKTTKALFYLVNQLLESHDNISLSQRLKILGDIIYHS